MTDPGGPGMTPITPDALTDAGWADWSRDGDSRFVWQPQSRWTLEVTRGAGRRVWWIHATGLGLDIRAVRSMEEIGAVAKAVEQLAVVWKCLRSMTRGKDRA